ncbi:ComF family protein [Salinibacterium xinjiangense]|nr:phosphoribosyltransferase family protein [Salinibacterium xinjiangense]
MRLRTAPSSVMFAWLPQALAAILDAWALLLPVECAGCGADDRGLCAACARELHPSATPRTTAGGLEVVTALRYEGRVRRVILAIKEHHRTDVAAALSRPLTVAIRQSLAAAHRQRPGARVEVAAVPTSRSSYRRRGYNPVAVVLGHTGYRPAAVLVTVRRTAPQKSLDSAGRASNLRGAMVARRSLEGRIFVIVDDVLTTGATMDEAARAIRAAGGEVAGAATIAFTPRMFAVRDNPSRRDYGGAKGAEQEPPGFD